MHVATKAYAALLHGINVGGHRKVPMAELRTLLTELGHGAVRTYLQSGNAVFTSGLGDATALAAGIRQAIAERFGFEAGVLVREHAYLKAVADACPFPAASLDGKQVHVTYLSAPLPASRFASLDPARYLPEEFRLGDRAIYLYAPNGVGRSKLADAVASSVSTADPSATDRNWNTVVKLVELTRI